MIHHDTRDGISVLRMEHGKANAFDVEFVDDLRRAFAAVKDARAVVLTGTGSIFSAGVDLFRVLDGGADYVKRFLPGFSEVLHEVFAFERPVVAAMNGHAIAGGCILACACDHRIMAAGSGRIGVPELMVGVPFPTLAIEIVRYVVPSHHAQELVYTGRTCEPAEALARGLVDRVVPPEQVLDAACEAAAALARIPAATFAITKRALRAPAIARIVGDAAAEHIKEIWMADETRAAIRAYLDRTLKK